MYVAICATDRVEHQRRFGSLDWVTCLRDKLGTNNYSLSHSMRLYFLIVIGAFAVSAYAAFLFVGEYRTARLSLASDTATFQILLNTSPPRPGSLYADKKIFLACHDAMTGNIAKLQPESALRRISNYCEVQARDALVSAPTSTLAQYTLALATLGSGDPGTANSALLASQQNGPFESWLAKRRFKLALKLGDRLNGDGQTAFDADISSLMQSRAGRIFLAKYFATRPALRDRILDLADALGEDVQAALLKEIGKSLKAGADGV